VAQVSKESKSRTAAKPKDVVQLAIHKADLALARSRRALERADHVVANFKAAQDAEAPPLR
jgi:hypothetical protein